MRKRRSKEFYKLGFIFVILILALTTISISYAGFTGTIYGYGTVTTWEELASISDFVWNDLNRNGIQEFAHSPRRDGASSTATSERL